MKVAEMFARAAALVSSKEPSTRAEVEAALRDCEARAKSAAAELERLAPRRAELLVSGTDAEVAKHDEAVSRTSLERDRAAAIAAKLKERLAVIVAEEEAVERDRRRAEAELLCDVAEEALRTRYMKAVGEVLAVLRAVATAQAATAAFAKAYPAEPHIPDPERTVRAPPEAAGEVLAERVVSIWVYDDGSPLAESCYSGVVGRGRRGPVIADVPEIVEMIHAGNVPEGMSGPYEHRGLQVHMVRKRRREVTWTNKERSPLDLFATISLPGLLPTDHGWTSNGQLRGDSPPREVLAALDRCREARRPYSRTVVEYLPIA